jgi:hypothetical protein
MRLIYWLSACLLLVGAAFLYFTKIASSRDGHARMLEILAQQRDKDLKSNALYGRPVIERAQKDLQSLPRGSYVEDRISLQLRIGQLQLMQGEAAAACDSFEEALRTMVRLRGILPPEIEQDTLVSTAVAHLRRGEIENCVDQCNCDSCILPISGGGIHQKKDGSEAAIGYFEELLKRDPQDLTARWLLNIAAMTVGRYPHDVPANALIPPAALESDRDFPRFMNMAASMGVDTLSLAGGIVADDFDNDGWLDLMVSDWGPAGQLRTYKNRGDGSFEETTEQAGLIGLYGGLNLVQADFDNDDDVDVLVLRGAWRGEDGRHPNSLLKNDGRGRFRDVTFEAGLGEAHYPTQTAAWADYDNDGDLDLYVGNETFDSQLFQNDGAGRFIDVAEKAGVLNQEYTKGVVWGDYDNDRYPDLYVSNYGTPNRLADRKSTSQDLFSCDEGAPNRLYRNNRDGAFTDVASELGVTKPMFGFATWFWDVNNDGALDLFAASYHGNIADVAAEYLGMPHQTEPDCLYLGDGKGGFREAGAEMGLRRVSLAMGANFGDLDNDGFPDFYLGTGAPEYHALVPNLCYWNQRGEKFLDVTAAGGFGHLQKGHGVAFADLDNDGDQEVAAVLGGSYGGDTAANAVFMNPGFDNQWLRLRLKGTKSNRSAIGAQVRVEIDEPSGPRFIHTRVSIGGSFGANPLRREIGLGQAKRIISLEVFWPTSGERQIFRDVPMKESIEVIEGKDDYRIVG